MRLLLHLLTGVFLCGKISGQPFFEISYGGSGSSSLHGVTHLRNDAIGVIGKTNGSANVYFVSAFQSNGSLAWERTFMETQNEQFEFTRIRPAQDGGLIVYGYYENMLSGGDKDPFLMKLDSAGQTQWMQIYRGAQDQNAVNMRPTRDGGYICTGYFASNQNNLCYFLLKTDSAGNREWGKVYLHPYLPKPTLKDVYEDENGDYICGGKFGDTLVVFKTSHTGALVWAKNLVRPGSLLRPDAMAPGHAPGTFIATGGTTPEQAYIIGMDTLGAVLWANAYTNFILHDAVIAPGSGHLLSGVYDPASPHEGMMLRIDNAGLPVWGKAFSNSASLSAVDTLQQGNGYALCGAYPTTPNTLPTCGYLLRTDTSAKLNCSENSAGVVCNPTSIIVSPRTLPSIDYFSAEPFTLQDTPYPLSDWIMCAGSVGIAENESGNAIHVWPVPANDRLRLEFPEDAEWNMQLTDVTGKSILKKSLRGKTHELSVENFPRGMYLLHAENGNTTFTQKIILQ